MSVIEQLLFTSVQYACLSFPLMEKKQKIKTEYGSAIFLRLFLNKINSLRSDSILFYTE